ncbi:hypothetical protein [Methanosarcina barkeri]|nr:hypothetical protein [Methanosarcina barkeri]
MLRYEMLVPTTWNFPTCSRALTGAPCRSPRWLSVPMTRASLVQLI